MNKVEDIDLHTAMQLIDAAEHDLGHTLSDGECRDLLSDNTEWDTDYIWAVVDQLPGRD